MSEPDLVIVSDLHLSEGRRDDRHRFSPMEDFFYDEAFARFLKFLVDRYRGRPEALKLVFNGDVFDFLTVTCTPTEAEAAKLGFKIAPVERRFGLFPTARKSVWKLDRIMDGHVHFFRALSCFVHAGHQLEILRGNHDLELYFEPVEQRLRARLASYEGGATEEEVAQRVRFHQWFYLEPGRVYVEHGNQYESSNSIRYPLRPVLPESRRKEAGEETLDYPLGSFFVRYFYNPIHRLHPHTPKLIAFEQYLEFLRRYNLLDMFRVARAHFPFFVQAVRPRNQSGTKGPSKAADAEQEEQISALDQEVEPKGIHRRLNALKIHPMSSSKLALTKELMLPLGKKVAVFGLVSFVSFYLWLVIFSTIQGTSFLAESPFAKAIFLAIFTLISAAGLFVFFSYLGLKTRSQKDEVVELCADRAEEIVKLTGVDVVVMGHTHTVDVRELGENALYVNCGTWTSVDNPWDRLHPDARRFTFTLVKGSDAQIMRWNDDAQRIDPVPLFDPAGDEPLLPLTAQPPRPTLPAEVPVTKR